MKSKIKLKGATVVITGASSGIGRATALRFAHSGSDVVLAARGKAALEATARHCRKHGVQALVVPTDTTSASEVEALAQQAVATFGSIDVWVNNASVTIFGAVETVPLEHFQRVLEVNVMGYVHGSRAALQHMRDQGSGVLINVSSAVANVPQPFTAAYSMSKAAVSALSVSLRSELLLAKEKNVHVVNIVPPAVDTPFFNRAANYSGRKARAMPPVYPPETIAKAIVKAAVKPRDEIAVGSGAKQLVKRHRSSPRASERMMALHVDRFHLSPTEPAPASTGNLYDSMTEDEFTTTGGWQGKRRSRRRKIIGAGLVMGTAGAGIVTARKLAEIPVVKKTTKAAGKVAGKTAKRFVK